MIDSDLHITGFTWVNAYSSIKPTYLAIVLGNDRAQTYYCRDLFHRDYDNEPFIFQGDAARTLKFFEAIESALNIAAEERLQFKSVSFEEKLNPLEGGKWFQVCPGWWQEPMRLSLLTILLRASSRHDSFASARKQEPYLVETSLALDDFMKGKTTYSGHIVDRYGWHFYCQNSKYHDKLFS